MKIVVFAIICLIQLSSFELSYAQTITSQILKGEIQDKVTGIKIAGALVKINNDKTGENKTTISDTNGVFEFQLDTISYDSLYISHLNYIASVYALPTYKSDIFLTFTLQPKTFELDEVYVKSKKDKSFESQNVNRIQIDDQSLKAGTGGEILRLINLLPGVGGSGDYSSQFAVRGGSPDQNLIIIDDIELFSPFQTNGIGSLINPEMIKSMDFYAGSFPAMYGDRLSSVLSISAKNGDINKGITGNVNTNLLFSGVTLEGGLPFFNGSWIISGRRTNYDLSFNPLANRINQNLFAFPIYYDVQSKLVLKPTENQSLSFNIIYSQDKTDWIMRQDQFGSQGFEDDELNGEVKMNNLAIGGSWLYTANQSFLKIYSNLYSNSGVSDLNGAFIPGNGLISRICFADGTCPPPNPIFSGNDSLIFNYDQNYSISKWSTGIKSYLVNEKTNTKLDFGISLDYMMNDLAIDLGLNDLGRQTFTGLAQSNRLIGALADTVNTTDNYNRYAAFTQLRQSFFNDKLSFDLGLRYDYNELISKGFISPRLGVLYSITTSNILSLGYGYFYQSPGFEKLIQPDNIFNLARFINLNDLEPEKAIHYTIGYKNTSFKQVDFKVEAYYKKYENLITQVTVLEELPIPVFRNPGNDDIYKRLRPENYYVNARNRFVTTNIPINNAKGFAYGLELTLVKNRNMNSPQSNSGWLTYSLMKTERNEVINVETAVFAFDYDRTHMLNLNFVQQLSSQWDLSFTWRYATGNPHTTPIAYQPLAALIYNPEVNKNEPVLFTDPSTDYVRFVPDYGTIADRNNDRLPDYNRFDLMLNFHDKFKWGELNVYIEFINVFNHGNIQSYKYIVLLDNENYIQNEDYKTKLVRQPIYMFPFIPSFGIKLSL